MDYKGEASNGIFTAAIILALTWALGQSTLKADEKA